MLLLNINLNFHVTVLIQLHLDVDIYESSVINILNDTIKRWEFFSNIQLVLVMISEFKNKKIRTNYDERMWVKSVKVEPWKFDVWLISSPIQVIVILTEQACTFH